MSSMRTLDGSGPSQHPCRISTVTTSTLKSLASDSPLSQAPLRVTSCSRSTQSSSLASGDLTSTLSSQDVSVRRKLGVIVEWSHRAAGPRLIGKNSLFCLSTIVGVPLPLILFRLDWMNEGGQSSTGQLLDFMLETHPAWPKLLEMSKQKGINHFVLLNDLLEEQMKETNAPFLTALTKNLHIYPDLHGTEVQLASSWQAFRTRE